MSKTNIIIFIITQNLRFGDDIQDMTTKVTVTLFALFAEIERGFIFSQTKGALAALKAQGIVLGKPEGAFRVSIFDKDRERIQCLACRRN
ncbi:MAG: hypothetical protein WBB64_01225 [Anaerolineales bacterium]